MSGGVTVLPSKLDTETEIVVQDFTSQLSGGEAITSNSSTSSVFSGTDASPQAMISGAGEVNGSTILQAVGGGVAGVIYQIATRVVTTLGQNLTKVGLLAVLPSPTNVVTQGKILTLPSGSKIELPDGSVITVP